MEDSVKDLDGDINPTTPEPRFSIGSKSLIMFNIPILLSKTKISEHLI